MQFFEKTSNHPGDLFPLQFRVGTLWLLAFPKTKITFEREEFSDLQWDSEKYKEAADWENCVRSQGTYFEGDWSIIVLCTMFLVSCIFFNKCLYYSYYMVQYFLHQELLVSLHKDLSLRWSLPHHCLCQKETCGAEWPQATCWPVSWS